MPQLKSEIPYLIVGLVEQCNCFKNFKSGKKIRLFHNAGFYKRKKNHSLITICMQFSEQNSKIKVLTINFTNRTAHKPQAVSCHESVSYLFQL